MVALTQSGCLRRWRPTFPKVAALIAGPQFTLRILASIVAGVAEGLGVFGPVQIVCDAFEARHGVSVVIVLILVGSSAVDLADPMT